MKKMGLVGAGVMMVLLAQAEVIQHRFLACDYMNRSIHHVDQSDTNKNWTLRLPEVAMDMQLIGNNGLLCNRSSGYDVYDLATRERVSGFISDEIKGVRSARRLVDGRTFLGTEGGTVYELDANNGLTHTHRMPPAIRYVRMIRFTSTGTLLIASEDGAYEVSLKEGIEPEDRVLRKFILPRSRNTYMALYSPDGNVLVSGGYAKGFFTFRPDGSLLKDTVVQQPAGLNNYFYAGFQLLPNGHTVLANWTGHSEKDFKPGLKIIELDHAYQPVWSWNEAFGGTVNQIIILDGLDTRVLHDDLSGILGPVSAPR